MYRKCICVHHVCMHVCVHVHVLIQKFCMVDGVATHTARKWFISKNFQLVHCCALLAHCLEMNSISQVLETSLYTYV